MNRTTPTPVLFRSDVSEEDVTQEHVQGMDPAQFEIHAEFEQKHWWFLARRQIIRDVLLALSEDPAADRVLDVGCGTGGNAACFAEQFPTAGVDVSQYAISLARHHFPQVDFYCGQVTDWPELVRSARLVTLLDVLEHVPDDFLLLSQILSLLEPGAYVVITVPADLRLWSPHDAALGHYRRYSSERLSQVWEGLPVEVRAVTYFNATLYTPIRMARWWNRQRGVTFGRRGTDLAPLPWLASHMFYRIFRGEAGTISRCLASGGAGAMRRGVSLLAVLRRTHGDLAPRTRPPQVPPDHYDPLERRYLRS